MGEVGCQVVISKLEVEVLGQRRLQNEEKDGEQKNEREIKKRING